MKAKRGQYGLLALRLYSYVLEIPNDAYILDHDQALLHSGPLKWKTKDWGTH